MSKRWIAAVLIALSVLGLCGCGGKTLPAVSMEELRGAMLSAAPSLPDMKSVSDADANAASLFSYFSDLDYGRAEHFFLSYSAKGLADEIAVIAVKDPADAAEAKTSLERHLTDRIRLYEQYQPDQVRRVEDAEVFVQGPYAVLIVCDEADAVKAAFSRVISGK